MGNYQLRVSDIMHTDIATILNDASVSDAAEMMRFEGVRSLIVMLPDKSDQLGIITYADIVSKVVAEKLDPDAVKVHEVMTSPAISVSPQLPVQDLAKLFRADKFGHAPVMEGSSLLGVVSMTDLVTEVISEPG